MENIETLTHGLLKPSGRTKPGFDSADDVIYADGYQVPANWLKALQSCGCDVFDGPFELRMVLIDDALYRLTLTAEDEFVDWIES